MAENKSTSSKKRATKRAAPVRSKKKAVKKVVKKATPKKAVKKAGPKKVAKNAQSQSLKSKFEGQLPIMDAIEKIAQFSQLDEGKLLTDRKTDVLSTKTTSESLESVTNAFKTVHSYMKHLCRKGKKELKSLQAQRGVKAIMIMASEAGRKIESQKELLKTKKGCNQSLEAFEKLCIFYQEKMVKRFQQQMSADALWEEEWEGGNMDLDLEHKGLKDLHTVKKDDSYELFYLRQDDGSPFFNRTLLRHIKLVHEFDESFQNELEDPLLQIHKYKDMLTHHMAVEIRQAIEIAAKAFYKEIEHHKKVDIIRNLHQMLISLLMACNSSTMAKNTSHKNSSEYFIDFLSFFRKVLSMHEYQQIIQREVDETDSLSKVIFELIFTVSHAIYTNKSDAPFITGFINSIVNRRGKKKWKESLGKLHTPELLSELLEIIDKVSDHLNLFPSGPLLKSFDILSEPGGVPSFDPMLLENYPSSIFSFKAGKELKTVLKLPSPTTQKYISKAELIDEFIAFLHALQIKKEKILYINLQNRLSWKEHARSQAVEQVGTRKEYEEVFNLISLNKGSEFYFQTAEYESITQTGDFLSIFKEQLISKEGSGFAFPLVIKKEIASFIDQVLPLLHALFFNKESKLDKKARMDFIEITYLFITLKAVSLLNPDYISFSCKDGIDQSMNATFAFYLFLKTIAGPSFFKEKEVDAVLSILFRPPLIVRERIIDTRGFHRVSSAIFVMLNSWYNKDKGPLASKLEALYPAGFFKGLEIKSD